MARNCGVTSEPSVDFLTGQETRRWGTEFSSDKHQPQSRELNVLPATHPGERDSALATVCTKAIRTL